MNLTANKREEETKSGIKNIRRKGNIPAVFYAPGQPGQSIEIDGAQYAAALRGIKSGRLSTTVFTLDLNGKKKKAIVKDVQYDLTSYKVIHLDFEELKDDTLVKVRVPIECIGIADCVGIKLGGLMRQVTRHVIVKCLPKNIPSEFLVNIQHLGMQQAMRLSDIKLPAGVETLALTDEVVVVVAKR